MNPIIKEKVNVLSLTILVAVAASSQAQQARFRQLDREQGLIHSAVSSIVQDSLGFIWLGTKNGLARYDGYSFISFQNDPFDANSLSHNLVQTLYMDKDDILWIGTYRGLNRFDPKTRTFTRYIHDPSDKTSLSNDVVTAIAHDAEGRLWVGTLDGLNRLDEQTWSFTRYSSMGDGLQILPNDTVRAIHSGRNNTLWIGTYGGLVRYNGDDEPFSVYLHDPEIKDSIASNLILDIEEDREGLLWIACWDGGLSRFNPSSCTAVSWSLPNNSLYTLEAGYPGVLYAGSWGGGLYEFDIIKEKFTEYRSKADDDYGLTHDVIYSLFVDHSDLLWIGTNGGGICTLDRNRDRFILYKHDPENPGSIAPGTVTTVLEDSRGIVWAGSYNGGLSRLNPGSDSFIRYTHQKNNRESLSNNIINAIVEDTESHIWIATNDGLTRIDVEENRIQSLDGGEDKDGPLADRTIYSMNIDALGRRWYGYFRRGAERYDPKSGERKRFSYDPANPHSLSDNLVYFIFIDSRQQVWLGTNNGLNLYDETSDTFTRFEHDPDNHKSLPSNTIRCMQEDSSGRLWIGSASGGLSLLDRETGHFTHVLKRDGLSDDTVVSILEDEIGRLWIGTNYGLNIYDPDSGNIKQLELMDGLQDQEFSIGAYKNNSGELYFCGPGGLNKIRNAALRRNTHVPPIRITSLKIFDKDFDPHTDPAYLESIALTHRENFVSIEFAALDYNNSSANQYMYRLEGFDKEWIAAGTRHYASYTNLPGGNYVFHVRASNNNDIWNYDGLRLPLTVKPSFWITPAAIVLYILLSLIILMLVYLWSAQHQQLRLSQEELSERRRIEQDLKVAKESAENANKAKSEFLAHLSHEIRTPINAITGYSDMLGETLNNAAQRSMIMVISRSARSLLALLNDALDLSRIEAGKERVLCVNFNLRQLVYDLIEMFRLRAVTKGIALNVCISEALPEFILSDQMKIRQILVNLIGNSVKFTEAGSVNLNIDIESVQASNLQLLITIEDTGPGISREYHDNVFEAFFQEPSSGALYGGTGLGLSIVKRLCEEMGGSISFESEKNHGSRFIVLISVLKASADAKSDTVRPTVTVSEELMEFSGYSKHYELDPSILHNSAYTPLVEYIRIFVLPLYQSISPVFILHEWEEWITVCEQFSGEQIPEFYAFWLQALRGALDALDTKRLKALAAELEKTFS